MLAYTTQNCYWYGMVMDIDRFLLVGFVPIYCFACVNTIGVPVGREKNIQISFLCFQAKYLCLLNYLHSLIWEAIYFVFNPQNIID